MTADGKKMVANSFYSGIFTSYDGGQTWAESDTNSVWWTPMAMTPDGSRVINGQVGSGIFLSTAIANHAPTTTPSTGGLTGGAGDSLVLQYLGSGLFGVFTSTTAGDLLSY
jgi:hypothetical protein